MWEDDQYWLPQVLNGESVDGYFQFSGERLVSFHVDPLGHGTPPKLWSASTRLRFPNLFCAKRREHSASREASPAALLKIVR